MKIVLNITMLAICAGLPFSPRARACPDLHGTYAWTSSDRRNPVTWKLTVTQDACAKLTYASTRDDQPATLIRDEKIANGQCVEVVPATVEHPATCVLYRFEGEALLGETFDRDAAGMPWIQKSALKITKTPDGNLREEFFEGAAAGSPLAAWEYSRE